MQSLFNESKCPEKILPQWPQILSPFSLILRWFDTCDTFKYLLLLNSYVYDQLQNYKLNQKNNSSQIILNKLINLNEMIEAFYTDLFNVSKQNYFSYSCIEYFLVNHELTKCYVNILTSSESNTASTEILTLLTTNNENNFNEKDEKLISLNSPSIQKFSKSIQALSIIDSLLFNLTKRFYKTNENKKNLATKVEIDELFTTNILIDTASNLQSLALLLNSNTSMQSIVELLSGPDGNMSNRYIDCLLNWLEISIADKLYFSKVCLVIY
jgi:hypothetical protein